MAEQRKYTEELRERAVKMVLEIGSGTGRGTGSPVATRIRLLSQPGVRLAGIAVAQIAPPRAPQLSAPGPGAEPFPGLDDGANSNACSSSSTACSEVI